MSQCSKTSATELQSHRVVRESIQAAHYNTGRIVNSENDLGSVVSLFVNVQVVNRCSKDSSRRSPVDCQLLCTTANARFDSQVLFQPIVTHVTHCFLHWNVFTRSWPFKHVCLPEVTFGRIRRVRQNFHCEFGDKFISQLYRGCAEATKMWITDTPAHVTPPILVLGSLVNPDLVATILTPTGNSPRHVDKKPPGIEWHWSGMHTVQSNLSLPGGTANFAPLVLISTLRTFLHVRACFHIFPKRIGHITGRELV